MSPGMVYLCTTQYSSRYLNTYAAHNTPVYNIQWNTFIPNIFITCASEWIIKIWDKDCKSVSQSTFESIKIYQAQGPGQFGQFQVNSHKKRWLDIWTRVII